MVVCVGGCRGCRRLVGVPLWCISGQVPGEGVGGGRCGGDTAGGGGDGGASPRCLPTSSRCPATAVPADLHPNPKPRPCLRTHGSAYAHAPAPHAPPQHRTTRSAPGPPTPQVPLTSPHEPTPTPTPPHQPTAPPMDSTGSAGPTRSSGSCKSRPGQSLEGLVCRHARGRRRTSASSRRGVDPAGSMGNHAGRCAPSPENPPPQPPRTSGTTRMSSDAYRRPSGRHGEKEGTCGHHPMPNPGHTQPLTTPKKTPAPPMTRSTPGTPRATQHDAPDPPASGAPT